MNEIGSSQIFYGSSISPSTSSKVANTPVVVVTGYGTEGQCLGNSLCEHVNAYNKTHPGAELTVLFSDGNFTVMGRGNPDLDALQSILDKINNGPKFGHYQLSLRDTPPPTGGLCISILPKLPPTDIPLPTRGMPIVARDQGRKNDMLGYIAGKIDNVTNEEARKIAESVYNLMFESEYGNLLVEGLRNSWNSYSSVEMPRINDGKSLEDQKKIIDHVMQSFHVVDLDDPNSFPKDPLLRRIIDEHYEKRRMGIPVFRPGEALGVHILIYKNIAVDIPKVAAHEIVHVLQFGLSAIDTLKKELRGAAEPGSLWHGLIRNKPTRANDEFSKLVEGTAEILSGGEGDHIYPEAESFVYELARTIAKNEGLSEKEAMRCILKAVTDITAVNERKKVITAMLKTN